MKQLLGVDVAGSYSFNKVAKTVTFTGLSTSISLANILVINDATANTLIYNFADSSLGATSFASNVLTLDLDTNNAVFANTDTLQIWLDLPASAQAAEVTTKETNVPDSLLTRIYHLLAAPLGYDKSLARQRSTAVIESGTVTTVSTVTTVTTLTTCSTLSNLAGIAGYGSQQSIYDASKFAWANTVRNRIT